MDTRARVFLGEDHHMIHHTLAPTDDTATTFPGTTDCGVEGTLTWVHNELVDTGKLCPGCVAVSGTNPPLMGADAGPP